MYEWMIHPYLIAVVGGLIGGLLKAMEDGSFTWPDATDNGYALGETNLVLQGGIYGVVAWIAHTQGLSLVSPELGQPAVIGFLAGYGVLNLSRILGKVQSGIKV